MDMRIPHALHSHFSIHSELLQVIFDEVMSVPAPSSHPRNRNLNGNNTFLSIFVMGKMKLFKTFGKELQFNNVLSKWFKSTDWIKCIVQLSINWIGMVFVIENENYHLFASGMKFASKWFLGWNLTSNLSVRSDFIFPSISKRKFTYFLKCYAMSERKNSFPAKFCLYSIFSYSLKINMENVISWKKIQRIGAYKINFVVQYYFDFGVVNLCESWTIFTCRKKLKANAVEQNQHSLVNCISVVKHNWININTHRSIHRFIVLFQVCVPVRYIDMRWFALCMKWNNLNRVW